MIKRELETEDLPIKDAFFIKPKEFQDERGAFFKIYDRALLKSKGVEPLFAEEYFSISKKGVLRGLHYQIQPKTDARLVRVVRGEVFDVIVDLREDSPTYGKYASVNLSDENNMSVYVPRGCAHGFLALKDDTIVSYRVDNDYSQECERGIRYDDPKLAIAWPEMDYIISEKDKRWPGFDDADKF